MKIMHLSDLHIGKKVNGYTMIEDQKYILDQVIKTIDDNKIETVLIAGDVYDKTIPPIEAVKLFDSFLIQLVNRKLNVLITDGNHDSIERLSFARELIKYSNVYISKKYDGEVEKVTLGNSINFYLMPFIKPSYVREYHQDEDILNTNDALNVVIKNLDINTNENNIILSHQFVTGATRCDSEDIDVGGSDNVDFHLYKDFDYVALGHIHNSQSAGKDTIRYCGTLLKYSVSEAKSNKSITIIDYISKDNININTIDLIPLRDLRVIKGKYEDITNMNNYKDTNTNDYVAITLVDEDDEPDALAKLRVIYPNILTLNYDNKRTQEYNTISKSENIKEKKPIELFDELYVSQNNIKLDDNKIEYLNNIINEVWGNK